MDGESDPLGIIQNISCRPYEKWYMDNEETVQEN